MSPRTPIRIPPVRSLWEQWDRAIRLRLIHPLKRSPHPPEYTARGVLVGLLWGLTPTVGIQMYCAAFTWWVCRRFFNWDFSLVIAVAWVWVSNPLTMVPMYYIFFVTGQAMLGHWADLLGGYHTFAALFHEALGDPNQDFIAMMTAYVTVVMKEVGGPMVLGSLPWAIGCGWWGYKRSLSFSIHHRERRLAKLRTKRSEGVACDLKEECHGKPPSV
ncbi:MAG: hypothetical protein COX57_03315 [Alphaproteobacteria bacterium CG_4_10_14_0_2_um_filter_63_37]|nr:MAG: hypothetical protein COX57_03315 [Alphaproteobacteria bacterium CG_4_10_14_0_2_um_filter_63_37]